uniref:alpha/beta hydrolase n=1 Tax=Sphaerotilus montanus TaxID=522889 RepID=UPI003FA2A8DF
MNAQTERLHVAGPAGAIEVAVDQPPGVDAPRGVAVLAHPHPLFGGTMDNKVVQTMARAFLQMGYRTVRFNFRGVGSTEGVHDEGRGESDDLLAVVAAQRTTGLPLVLGGFSFGAYVTTLAAAPLEGAGRGERLLLVGAVLGDHEHLSDAAGGAVVQAAAVGLGEREQAPLQGAVGLALDAQPPDPDPSEVG